MISGMYSAAQGMDAATARHELAAQNIAFSAQPGYRRTATHIEAFADSLHGVDDGGEPADDNARTTELAVDFTPGTLEQTGRTLDVALQGDGFFVVEGPRGPLYTRSGRWQLTSDGALVSMDGLPIRSQSGEVRLPASTPVEQLQITSDGRLQLAGQSLGQLELVRFDDPSRLRRAGVSLFSASEEAVPEPSDATVMQGLIEHSNVQPVSELISLVVASRQYEAAQLALKSLHDAVGLNVQR